MPGGLTRWDAGAALLTVDLQELVNTVALRADEVVAMDAAGKLVG